MIISLYFHCSSAVNQIYDAYVSAGAFLQTYVVGICVYNIIINNLRIIIALLQRLMRHIVCVIRVPIITTYSTVIPSGFVTVSVLQSI